MTRAVLAYRQEHPGATKADIATACCVPVEEVLWILEPTDPNVSGVPCLDLDWSRPVPVWTKSGEQLLRTAEPTKLFWKVWQNNKDKLKAAGIYVTKMNAEWVVCCK